VPRLNFSSSVAAGATFLPLNGWQYEYVPFGGVATFMFWTTATGVVVTVTSGSDTLMERSPIDIGAGAAGDIPSQFEVDPLVDEVAAGDRLKLLFENTTGGALNVMGYSDYKF
jgi:hypothetical protein